MSEYKKQLFLRELFDLYEKHNISISHEDCHGGFILCENDEYNRDWMSEAEDCTESNS